MRTDELKQNRRYRLTRDVANPVLDRRAVDDVRRLNWSAGDVFRASRVDEDMPHCLLDPLKVKESRYRPCRSLYRGHPGWEALVEALEELPLDVSDILSEWHLLDAELSLLRFMVESGRMSLGELALHCSAKREHDIRGRPREG